MRYALVFAPESVDDLRCLKAKERSDVQASIERHLRLEPRKTSKSRIKRLRGLSRPQFRLRADDDLRVFYDVTETVVEILAVVAKSEANQWLEKHGESDEESSADRT